MKRNLSLNKDIQQEIVQDKISIDMLVFQLQSQEGVKGQENKKKLIFFQINIFCVMFKKK